VFCLPSRGPEETWGLAVNEAMACGRPILVSDRCGCAPDLVAPGQNGFIFEAGNAGELTAKMSFFLEEAGTALRLGAESCRRIGRWSFEILAPAIEKSIPDKHE